MIFPPRRRDAFTAQAELAMEAAADCGLRMQAASRRLSPFARQEGGEKKVRKIDVEAATPSQRSSHAQRRAYSRVRFPASAAQKPRRPR